MIYSLSKTLWLKLKFLEKNFLSLEFKRETKRHIVASWCFIWCWFLLLLSPRGGDSGPRKPLAQGRGVDSVALLIPSRPEIL